MDHDRLFKELLTHNFSAFVTAFLPGLLPFIELDSIEFLDKEIFTDIASSEQHEADLIVKVRFRGKETFLIIHVENQASPDADFPRRMFMYFARLHEKLVLPIYPVVIFSYDKPKKPASNLYSLIIADKTVLAFDFTVVQLNRLNWRDYLNTPNPVSAALMTKMKIAPEDKAKVRAEIFRMMLTLKLDPARSKLIGAFMEAYLKLTAAQQRQYEVEYAKFLPEEREQAMEIMSSWERTGLERGLVEGISQGIAQGLTQGKESLVLRQIGKRFGSEAPPVSERLDRLSAAELDELGEALFDFKEPAELEDWLAQRIPQ